MPSPLQVLFLVESDIEAGSLARVLLLNGYEVQWERAEDAAALRRHPAPHIVIAAFEHPLLSAVLEVMRTTRVPCILLADEAQEDEAIDLLRTGVQDVVSRRHACRLIPAVERALREVDAQRSHEWTVEALRKSEERYRDLIENANDVIFTIDLEGNFTSLNRAGEEISGYSREEVQFMNMAQVLLPEHLTRAFQMIRQKLADNRPTMYELSILHKDGHEIPLEVSTTLIMHDGKPVGVQGIARDITERRRAAQALRESEERYRALFENASDIVYTHDLRGNFTSINHVAEKITGYTQDEVLRLNISDIVAPEDLDLARDMIRQKLAGSPVTAYEVDVLAKDGRRTRVEVNSQLIYENGRPVAVHGIARDITERRRMEEERALHARELATRVLQAQEEERKRIARELHDETAQSLSMLLTHLDLLESHIPADRPDLVEGFDRVARLAKRALDETRAISHDLRPTILDDVGLAAALDWIAAEHERTYGAIVKVKVTVPSLLPEMEVALFRIAQEALSNAGRHARSTAIQIALTASAEEVIMTVVDNGQGFDLARVPRPTREGRLGLYGMRERASLLGGALYVDTAPGKGTRIEVHLPLAALAVSA